MTEPSLVPTAPLTGSCLCGGIRFELSEAPQSAGYCHCTRCQGRTGSGFSASARTTKDAFRLTRGEGLLGAWRHPDGGMEKCFCTNCGAHLLSREPEGQRMTIRMSAFDRDPGVRPSFRAFTDYAVSWEEIPDDGLPRFPERKPDYP